MGKIYIDDAPDDLVKRLEVAAAARKRRVDDEVIERLADSFGPTRHGPDRSPQELLELARQIRSNDMDGSWLTPEFIRMARERGRE